MTTESDRIEYGNENGGQPVSATELSGTGDSMAPLADRLLETGVPDDVDTLVEGETNEDHVLAYLQDEELWERRFNIMNNEEFLLAMYPPEESMLQGDLREEFGLPGPKQSLAPTTEHELSDTKDAAYARSTRARNGFQQKQLVKTIQEMRRVDGDMEAKDGGGGLLSGFLGGGN